MLRRLLIAAAAVTCFQCFAQPTAWADQPSLPGTRPATATSLDSSLDNNNDRPRAASPYWNNSGPSNGNASDLPSTDIRAVAPARAADVSARWTYNQLLVDLSNATRSMVGDLEAREEFRKAVNEERVSYDAMSEARRKALAPLANNDAYMASEALRRTLTEQIKDAHDRPRPDSAQIEAMARLKLSYVGDNRKLEQDALERDSEYQNARSRYLSASNAVSEQRQSVALMIARDDGLRTLRHQVAESRIAKLASAAYLDSTINARDIALSYAGYYRRTSYLQSSGYANGFYPFGYGSGYGYGGGGYRY